MARETPKSRLNRASKQDRDHANKKTSEKTSSPGPLELHTGAGIIEQFGVRLPKELIDRIRIASATRKMKGVDPQTLAEITAEALTEWADRNSH